MDHLIAIIFVLIIMLFSMTLMNNNKQTAFLHKYLMGLWVGDSTFCDDSGIDGMLLYIGQGAADRSAYLIIHSDDCVILEKKIDINFSSWTVCTFIEEKMNKQITINSDEDLEKFMPAVMTATIDFACGSMVWRSDDTIYAKFYKDNNSSNLDSQ